jgi:hypothetical protein
VIHPCAQGWSRRSILSRRRVVLRRLRTPRRLIIAPLSYGETVGTVRRTTGSEIHLYKA